MKNSTLTILRPLLQSDETITADQTRRALDILTGTQDKHPPLEPERYSYNGLGFASAITIQPADPQMPAPVTTLPPDKLISENDAIRQVRGLGLDYRTLREYGIKTGQVQKDGRNYNYSSQFIADLAGNYFTCQEAMDLLKMPKSTFFVWKNSEGIECIQIGQVGLYRKDVIINKKRAG